MTDANKLAESLRAMRRNARRAYVSARPGASYSITMDAVRLGNLTDAADLIERQAAELERLNAPAVLLTDEQIHMIFCPLGNAGRIELMVARMNARDVEAAVLAANGKAVS